MKKTKTLNPSPTVAANVQYRKHQNSLLVRVRRNNITQARSFLISKWGGYFNALRKAREYAMYLKEEATPRQFKAAYRRVGRPSKTEFFGRRLIKN